MHTEMLVFNPEFFVRRRATPSRASHYYTTQFLYLLLRSQIWAFLDYLLWVWHPCHLILLCSEHPHISASAQVLVLLSTPDSWHPRIWTSISWIGDSQSWSLLSIWRAGYSASSIERPHALAPPRLLMDLMLLCFLRARSCAWSDRVFEST
jgi:hypothetical protein